MIAGDISDFAAIVAIVGICVVCLWLAYRIEPHWVSRDGQRFLTVAQELDQWGLPVGRRHEVRVRIDDEADTLVLSRRSLLRPSQSNWVIDAKVPAPPKGRVVYVLKQVTAEPVIGQTALRLPNHSKVIPSLDALLATTGAEAERNRQLARQRARPPRRTSTATSDSPESPQSDQPPDPS